MCEKAVEIQESYRLRVPACDDIFAGKITRGLVLLIQLSLTNKPMTDDYIWLPRVEQLAGMIDYWDEFAPIDHMSHIYSEFEKDGYDCGSDEYSQSFKTLSELFLAYLMEKNHLKVWDADKKEWVEHKKVVWDSEKKTWVERKDD